MDHQVIWTDPAIDDLQAVVIAIAQDNSQRARLVGDSILDHADVLATFPRLGPIYEATGGQPVRVIFCDPYQIFYRVFDDQRSVEIMHVRHAVRQSPRFRPSST